jgi:hypothetical protein
MDLQPEHKLLYRFLATTSDLETNFASRSLNVPNVRAPPVDRTADVTDLGGVMSNQSCATEEEQEVASEPSTRVNRHRDA